MTRLPWIFLFLALVGLGFLIWQASGGSERSVQAPTAEEEQQPISLPGVPDRALRAYQRAAEAEGVSWKLLLALGEAESDHGRSPLPGVRSGINSAECCAGPMQLCVSDSCGNVASTYARDGNEDGSFSVYGIEDAAHTAAAYLKWMENRLGRKPRILAAAYNAGPTIVEQEGIPPYPETRAYVRKTMRTLRELG